MSQTAGITKTDYNKLISRIDRLERTVKSIAKKQKEPVYGSDGWWEEEIKAGLAEAKEGKGVTFSTAEELQAYLDELKESDEN